MKKNLYSWLLISIFGFSGLLRLLLALVNREANDNHMQVAQLMIQWQRLPIMADCRECFHPKFFYAVAAGLFQIFQVNAADSQNLFMQLVNFACGMLILWLLWKFIQTFSTNTEGQKLLAFALVAFNPKFVGISSQASNDIFSILFSSLALFFTAGFIKKPCYKSLAPIILFLLLAISTKVTGWIAFIAIFLCLLFMSWHQHSKKMWEYAFVLPIVVMLISTLNPLSQFITNLQIYHRPIANSSDKQPFPPFFTDPLTTRYGFRPGITSVVDGFMTFRLDTLLKYPIITNGDNDYPVHRTSFWTMLYADANSLHFQNWPASWQARNEDNFNISRGIMLLALFPALTLLAGLLLELFDFPKNLKTGSQVEMRFLFLVTCLGYLSFLMLTALLYRDFSFIKLIYILPGLFAYTWFFLRGAQKWPNHGLVTCVFLTLIGFYIADISSMIYQLYRLVAK